jgi:uncharacterized protein
MTFRFSWASGLLAAAALGTIVSLAANSAVAADPAKKSRVLMVTQSAGFVHGSVRRPDKERLAPAEVAMTQLGQQSGLYEIHCTQDVASDFTKENLQNYDIVRFYTTLDLPIAAADLDYFLNDWLKQKGHGFIGFHSASDTFHNHQPYWDMVGGTFAGHPWNAGDTVTIAVHDPEHPLMKPFGNEVVMKEEIYQYKNWQPEKVRVLMSLDMSRCQTKKPYHVPVAWVKEYGDGRVYYNNLGHNESTWTNKAYLESITNAIRWIRGEIELDARPNPELSKEQEAKARKDAVS